MKLTKLIPVIAGVGSVATIATPLSSCAKAEEIILTWVRKEGQPFVPTIPSKEFKGTEGTFNSADDYLSAYHKDISEKPLIYAEDFIMHASEVNPITAISMYQPKIGDIKNIDNSNGYNCHKYFTLSIDFLFSGKLTNRDAYKEFRMSYQNIPMILSGTGDYDNNLCPSDEILVKDDAWSVTIPEITKLEKTEHGYYDIECGQNPMSYNRKKLNELEDELYWQAIGDILCILLDFKSTYFKNAVVNVGPIIKIVK